MREAGASVRPSTRSMPAITLYSYTLYSFSKNRSRPTRGAGAAVFSLGLSQSLSLSRVTSDAPDSRNPLRRTSCRCSANPIPIPRPVQEIGRAHV